MKEKLPITFILILSIFIVHSLILPGFVPTHDGEYHIIRFWQFDKNIQEGNFLPIWAPDLNNGLGIPLFEFFYPLPNYIGEIFHIFGFSFVDSVQLTLASSLVFSGIFFYFWMRCFFDKKFSLLGSFLYMLAPYHLVDIFIRGSVGESWSLALAPLVLLLITKNIQKSYKSQFSNIITPIFLMLLLISHNILGIVFFTLSFLYGIFTALQFKKKINLFFLSQFIFSLFLSSFFWLPILFEKQFISGLKIIDYQDHFPAFFQLIFPSWGSGFSVPGVSDQMSFQIGIPHVTVLIFAFLHYLLKRKKDLLLFFLLAVFILTFFLLSEFSIFIWQAFPFLSYFQYPWRLLSLVILTSSFLAGYLSFARLKGVIFYGLLIITFLFYLPYTKPVVYEERTDDFYLKNDTWSKGGATLGNTFNTIWLAANLPSSRDKTEITQGDGSIVSQKLSIAEYAISVENQTPVKLTISTAYFPGWKAAVDDKAVDIDHSNGLINLFIPEGEHSIMIRLEDTLVRSLGKVITIFSFSAMIIFHTKFAFKKNEHSN